MSILSRSIPRAMSNRPISPQSAVQRTQAIARHIMNTAADNQANAAESAPILFKENLALRTYVLNRPKKLNALDVPMLDILRPKVEEWNKSELCGAVVGTGVGRAFCAGGDVAGVVELATNEDTRPKAVDFFKREFELDYILATLSKPYVVLMDGITMGGGVGLSAPAPFRVATENTVFAMPETKIGYCPDVGASFFLSRLDGELGTYLALTGETLKGRAVFEFGFATHFVPSARLPQLLTRLAALESATPEHINRALEELSDSETPSTPNPLTGAVRAALDSSFAHDTVEAIVADLDRLNQGEGDVAAWAKNALAALALRSPTSLKVSLAAVRRGRDIGLFEALQMELNIATAFCSGASPDFSTGVRAVIVDKIKTRPEWSPSSLAETPLSDIEAKFFDPASPFLTTAPRLAIPPAQTRSPMRWTLPSERSIRDVVIGSGRGAGGTALTTEEVVERVEALCGRKAGAREKVEEVLTRKCELVAAGGGDQERKWVKWKH